MPDFHEDSPYNAISGVSNGRPGLRIAFGGRRFPLCFPCHSWKTTAEGAWGYGECRRCGRRKAWRGPYVLGPVDMHWVLTGTHRDPVPPLPPSLVKIGGMPSAEAKPDE